MRLLYILWRFGDDLVSVLSRLLNAMFFNGSTAQTLSARAYVETRNGKKYWPQLQRLINTLFFWEGEHCKQAWAYEVERAKRVLEVNEVLP